MITPISYSTHNTNQQFTSNVKILRKDSLHEYYDSIFENKNFIDFVDSLKKNKRTTETVTIVPSKREYPDIGFLTPTVEMFIEDSRLPNEMEYNYVIMTNGKSGYYDYRPNELKQTYEKTKNKLINKLRAFRRINKKNSKST